MRNIFDIILIFIIASLCFVLGNLHNNKKDAVIIKPQYDTINVICTTYQPTKSQCDNTPFQTASLDYIEDNCDLKWVAVSRDLIHWNFNFNDTITIVDADSNGVSFEKSYIVKDIMNKRYSKRIDILCFNDKLNTMFNAKILIKK